MKENKKGDDNEKRYVCVFSLISLYNQTPESTLLPVLVNKIEKHKETNRRTSHQKKERKKEMKV